MHGVNLFGNAAQEEAGSWCNHNFSEFFLTLQCLSSVGVFIL